MLSCWPVLAAIVFLLSNYTHTIVLYQQANLVGFARHDDAHVTGMSVLGYVVQRLLHAAVQGHFQWWRETSNVVCDRHSGAYARAARQVLGFFADGGDQPQFLQYQRR